MHFCNAFLNTLTNIYDYKYKVTNPDDSRGALYVADILGYYRKGTLVEV